MKVLIAEQKDAEARGGRVRFEDVLERCPTLVLTCPLNNPTRQLITIHELRKMQSCVILINVGRGGLWCEADVVKALEEIIAGVGTDVFEPRTGDAVH